MYWILDIFQWGLSEAITGWHFTYYSITFPNTSLCIFLGGLEPYDQRNEYLQTPNTTPNLHLNGIDLACTYDGVTKIIFSNMNIFFYCNWILKVTSSGLGIILSMKIH